MKVEFKVREDDSRDIPNEVKEMAKIDGENEISIDIGQVLAANQALLKNMARKMDQMEKKLSSMEVEYNKQRILLEASRKETLMISAPVKEIKPWEPEYQELSEDYFKKFSAFDRIFKPWKLRRKDLSN